MNAAGIEALFTGADGAYRFARWGRPVAPVVFGVEAQTLEVCKAAIGAVATLAGQSLNDIDPELGANMMWFFFRDWEELREVPDLDRMVPDLPALLERLEARGANQYRVFRFDAKGGIRACFVFLRMDAHLSDVPADALALSQAVQGMLTWAEGAFRERSPLVTDGEGRALLRPDIAAIVRAAHDPVMPVAADDPAHALRLAARLAPEG